MVRRVNVLASRATDGGGHFGPTVAAANLRVLIAALQQLGFAASTLFAAAGIPPDALDDPDAHFPIRAYLAMVQQAQRERPDLTNLALHVAAASPLGAGHPTIDYLAVTSDTVGAAFEQLARHFSMIGAPVYLGLDTAGDPIKVLVRSPFHPFGAEYTVALHFLYARRETDGRFSATEVAFQHEPEDLQEWERAVGCPVRARVDWTGMAVSREVWALPLKRRDPVLRGVLERHAGEIEERLPSADDVGGLVRRVLLGRILGGDTRIEAVARQLGTAPRTLQRRLAAAGLAYNQVLDDVRRVTAEHHLAGSVLSIGEIAFLLGYADRTTFHKAFRRWTGLTPQAYRAQLARLNQNDHRGDSS